MRAYQRELNCCHTQVRQLNPLAGLVNLPRLDRGSGSALDALHSRIIERLKMKLGRNPFGRNHQLIGA